MSPRFYQSEKPCRHKLAFPYEKQICRVRAQLLCEVLKDLHIADDCEVVFAHQFYELRNVRAYLLPFMAVEPRVHLA